MSFHRRAIRGLCAGLIALLLFTQLAVAAYACPALAPALPAATQSADEMPNCHGQAVAMDAEQPRLCQAHCQPDDRNTQPAPPADLPTAAATLLAVLDWGAALHLPEPMAADRPELAPGAAPPGAPPLYLALRVLRN